MPFLHQKADAAPYNHMYEWFAFHSQVVPWPGEFSRQSKVLHLAMMAREVAQVGANRWGHSVHIDWTLEKL